jgi:hypothetical protein
MRRELQIPPLRIAQGRDDNHMFGKTIKRMQAPRPAENSALLVA